MTEHFFTGFGFGPVQGGLFANEAFQSGNFARIVIAEIDKNLIEAVRANDGTYFVNVAKTDGIQIVKIDNIELLNPNVDKDKNILLDALSESTEIATCLPSVSFYTMGDNGAASLLAQALQSSRVNATIIYAAENNNSAAEILQNAVTKELSVAPGDNVQFLNTVIGKMSRVVTDSTEIEQLKLTPIAPGINRAFLVEQFNRILVTKCAVKDFEPGIKVFIEKKDLLPYEEAKLYGHNAIHTLLAYLGMAKGYKKMTELKDDADLMKIATKAFLDESGAALIKKYSSLGDELFTKAGYRCYAEDLLERMTNPYLGDTTSRAGRDIARKLGCNDRIFGTMSLALDYGIEPVNMAVGAAAALCQLLVNSEKNNLPEHLRFADWQQLYAEKIYELLIWLWRGQSGQHCQKMTELVHQALPKLTALLIR
jgi:mannitol-1-phosphate/altronate dehydrogenase